MPETINIMTSCDDRLAPYILPQIASIGVNLKQYNVNFYLFHSRITPDNVERLRTYSGTFDNITFHEAVITDTAPYEEITKRGGHWAYEAYFTLCCHEYLPADVDRILYIDAGDVVINGDVSEYYRDDFEGCSLIVTLGRFTYDKTPVNSGGSHARGLDLIKSKLDEIQRGVYKFDAEDIKARPYNREDMSDPERLDVILWPGVFNSGSFMINVAQFRADRRTMADYLYLYNVLCERYPGKEKIYLGDQGFLSAAFLGDIKYFNYPAVLDMWYMPYNFGTWFFNEKSELWYTPAVIHFGGPATPKPWNARYSRSVIDKYSFGAEPRVIHAPCYLTGGYLDMYDIWWKYCEMTPVYEELNRTAGIAARALEEHFLPLCQWYNELADEYLRATGKEPPHLMQRKLFNNE